MDNNKACLLLVFLVCWWACLSGTSSPSDNRHVYLQRDKTGVLQCPLIGEHAHTVDKVDSIYWYKGRLLLISKFWSSIIPGPQSPSGKYSFNEEHSLVIDNVTDADGFTYTCKVKPKDGPLDHRPVEVSIFVSPSDPFPKMEGCNMTETAVCQTELPPEEATYNLTCCVTNTRPAVDLQWLHVLEDGSTVEHIGRPHNEATGEDLSLFNSCLNLTNKYQNEVTLRCSASGVAMGENGSYVEVRVTKQSLTWETEFPDGANAGIDTVTIVLIIALVVGIPVVYGP